MEPEWSLWVHEAITGDPIRRVDWAESSDAPFKASIAGDGESTIAVSVVDADAPWQPGDIASVFTPNSRLLVRWWGTHGGAHPDDTVMTAHKIEAYDYDDDAGIVSVSAVDLLNEAEWRLVDGVGSSKYSTLTITNRSASGAVAQTLARMMRGNSDWAYPIDLPTDSAGPFSGSYVFWKGFSIAEILAEIKDSQGVEIYLRPYATATGGVRFQTRVGAPITLGGTTIFLGAAETPIAGVKYRVDGGQQVTGILGLGNGTGEVQETRWAGTGPYTIPIRDTKKSFKDMLGDPLQSAATQAFLTGRNPVAQWDIGTFVISEDYPPELAAPGRVFNVEVHGNPVIPDGVHTLRVIAVSGGNGRQLKPEVQYVGA